VQGSEEQNQHGTYGKCTYDAYSWSECSRAKHTHMARRVRSALRILAAAAAPLLVLLLQPSAAWPPTRSTAPAVASSPTAISDTSGAGALPPHDCGGGRTDGRCQTAGAPIHLARHMARSTALPQHGRCPARPAGGLIHSTRSTAAALTRLLRARLRARAPALAPSAAARGRGRPANGSVCMGKIFSIPTLRMGGVFSIHTLRSTGARCARGHRLRFPAAGRVSSRVKAGLAQPGGHSIL
jgi:hypothetical protein